MNNEELKKKIDLIKAFIGNVIPEMKEGDSVDDAYATFEEEARTKEIEDFGAEAEIDVDKLKGLISEYEFSGIISEDDIHNEIGKDLPFRKRKELRNKVTYFITDNTARFTI